MRALHRAAGLLLLLGGSARAAEHDWPVPPETHDAEQRVAFSLGNRAGLVEAPFVTAAFPEVSGFGDAVMGTAAWRWPGVGWLRLKAPLAIVRLDFPAGAQVAETSLGNLELGLEHLVELDASARVGFVAAFVAPTAQHGSESALLDHRALAIASALNGGKDLPLWTPGVSGLRLGASVEHSLPPFDLRASFDLPLLVRVSGASLPEETETNPLGILPVLDLRAAWWAASWFAASFAATAVAEPLRVHEPALDRDRKRRLQLVLEPGVHARLGRHVGVGLDGSVPVAGNLGGDAWSIGLYGRAAF